MSKIKIPEEIKEIGGKLIETGFEAYAVGGCVRDILISREPKDWDITTNAKPEEISKIFPDSVYENEFGTVGVKTGSEKSNLAVVEVTTFRSEEKYSDKRHPDAIHFVSSLEEDLKRRDFTINSMAIELMVKRKTKNEERRIVDLFNGQEDLKNKLIRAVGDAGKRFNEDALRMIRAVRFASELDFEIEPTTKKAISSLAHSIQLIAKERISKELEKIIMSAEPWRGFEMLHETGLLKFIIPELEEGWNVGQNKHHIYTVWEHNMRALQYAADKNYSFEVRLASLLHDVGKPRTKHGDGPDSTFYGHEVVGARMTAEILERLRFSKEITEKVTLLVRYHLFYYETEQVTDSSVRRLVQKVGIENIQDLVKVREADRIGSGVPKAVPYKLRHFMFRVEKVLHEPVSLKQLKISGTDVMVILKIEHGPKVGMVLNALFEEVLDNPKKNRKDYLEKRARELGKLSETELQKLAATAKKKYADLLGAEEEKMKKKYYVK